MSEVDSLSERMAAWCVAGVPGAKRLVSVERLRGGLAAITHSITVEGEQGASQWVLRSGLTPRPDRVPAQEIARTVSTLALLAEHPQLLSAPTVAAHDATGEVSGEPALLMSRLPGRADVSLQNAARTVEQMARTMARFHAARLVCPPGHGRYSVDLASRARPVPAGIVAPNWQRVFDHLETLDVDGAQMIHHDLHLGNVLFDGEQLSGIVDWTEARTGPWQFDVGYCRVDLSLLFGLEAADAFLAAYESERGERMSERPLWDLAGAVEAFPDPEKWRRGWLELGRLDLSADGVRERLTVFVERALSQVPGR